jgi:hypothetical protein
MSKHKTSRGREFNMQAFAANQGDKIAVGNSGRNARGDLLGPGGKVIATKQEIAGRVHDRNTKPNSTKVKLNPLEQEVARKEVVGIDGVSRIEITYADGSVEIIENKKTDIDSRSTTGDF